ncbi:MAG: transglycosylase SLT domain-containing protein [Candidatus Oxydemutatoraceae bacterium WSBS_2016_MAG_OTU14]
MAVRTGFNSLYFYQGQITGPTYDLLTQFSQYANKALHLHFVRTPQQAFALLDKEKVDFATGFLVLPPADEKSFISRLNYLETQNILIHHYQNKTPSSLKEIRMKNIEVGANPMHLETLQNIRRQNNDPTLWSSDKNTSSEDLLHFVDQGMVAYAVVDWHEWLLAQARYPRVKQSFTLASKLPIAWILRHDSQEIANSLEKFEQSLRDNQELDNIIDRYYGHAETLHYSGRLTLLNGYKKISDNGDLKLIQSVAKKYNIDWTLLAAISYQESHWKANAKSPSGVKGFMMITQKIADKFNVEDRYSIEQSLPAGTQYFLSLRARLNKNIAEPDRTWYALIAYNIGYRKLRQLMTTTRKRGVNPYLWVNLKQTIAQNTNPEKWRPNVPMKYVYNVRAYQELIKMIGNEHTNQKKQKLKWIFRSHRVGASL